MFMFNGKNVTLKRLIFDRSQVLVEYVDDAGRDTQKYLYNDNNIVLYLDGIEVFTGCHSEDKERHDIMLLDSCDGDLVTEEDD